MKIAKRILAIVMTALMLVSTVAVAASSAGSLQAAIDAAAAGDTVTMSANTTESVVIDKDLTLDLGGYRLTSEEGKAAVTIKNADVTVTNGQVYSRFAAVRTITMIDTVKNESPAAIRVEGGNVHVDGVRAVGSMTRIPGQSKYALPTGSAVELLSGATATISNASLFGRYGVNNKVTNNPEGGTVTIEDGILIGFMKAVKDVSKEVLDGAEKVNAADRIEGFLNSGIKLEERERRLMKQVFADRAMVYTQSVEDDAKLTKAVCVHGVTDTVTVEAHEDTSNLWQNAVATDCTYKYVPEYAVLADGKLVKLEKNGDAYTTDLEPDQADGVRIKYRLEFEMLPDIKRYATNFDKYLQKAYDLAIEVADSLYGELCSKYDNYVGLVHRIFTKIDEMGTEVIPISDKPLYKLDEYQRIVHALLDLGGETMYYGNSDEHFGPSQLNYFYGDPNYKLPAGEYYGVLDQVAEFKGELEAIKGASFADQSMWADLGYWFYENYRTVIDMIDDVAAKIDALQQILSTEIAQAAIQEAGLQNQYATLNKIESVIGDAQKVIGTLLGSHTISAVLQKLDNNKSEIKPYINKMISIYNNHAVYFTPEKFIDGDFAKAYAVYGDAEKLSVDAQDVLWAGYASQIDTVELDEGERPAAKADTIYVIAKAGACKIQIRDAARTGTLTYNDTIGAELRRHPSVESITPVTYMGVACDLWVINRLLSTNDYVAIAKYNVSQPINQIPNEKGAAFSVNTDPLYDTTVYSATIAGVDPELGYIVFDGASKQTITIVTGVDVSKVQLAVDNTIVTLTYNKNNAEVTESTLDGKPVLVWTIRRMFSKSTYNYSINTRSVFGLADSGVDLSFRIADRPIAASDRLISAEGQGTNDGRAIFTVKTGPNALKVRFTNVVAGNTITVNKTNPKAVVTENEDGTLTWVITINHMVGTGTYNVQVFDTSYTPALQVSVTVTNG